MLLSHHRKSIQFASYRNMKQNHTLIILGFLSLITCSQVVTAGVLNDCDRRLLQDFIETEAPNNRGINGHGRIKAHTLIMNIDIKRMQTVPNLKQEMVFQIGQFNVLSRVGEISLNQSANGFVVVDLRIDGVLDFSNKTFAARGDYNNKDGVFYVLSDQGSPPPLMLTNFEIYYYPDSMRLVLQAKEWKMPVPLRLNHPKRNF